MNVLRAPQSPSPTSPGCRSGLSPPHFPAHRTATIVLRHNETTPHRHNGGMVAMTTGSAAICRMHSHSVNASEAKPTTNPVRDAIVFMRIEYITSALLRYLSKLLRPDEETRTATVSLRMKISFYCLFFSSKILHGVYVL